MKKIFFIKQPDETFKQVLHSALFIVLTGAFVFFFSCFLHIMGGK